MHATTCLTLALSAGLAAAADPPGFTLAPGFPVTTPITNWDGGMFVNMDEDAELEFVASAGSRLVALNLDGTDVAGWPLILGDSSFGAPAWGDVDGDGENEIVQTTFFFGINSRLFVVNTDGSPVPGFGNFIAGTFKSPTLADMNDDGDMEVIVSGNNGGIGELYVYDGDGSVMPGFPFSFGEIVSGQSAAVGDIDNDGDPEIVVASFYRLFAFESDGSVMPGFPWVPTDVTHAFNSYNSPSLVDADFDGDLEIVISTAIELQGATNTAPQVHILHHDATPLDGWPQTLPTPGISTGGATTFLSPTLVADIDNDGRYDVIASDSTLCPFPCNVIMAWDISGDAKSPFFPIPETTATQQALGIADIDGDGNMEIFQDSNLAANPPQVWDALGGPVPGWQFADLDGSGSPTFGDPDHDGFMDFMMPANNITTAVSMNRFFLYQSETIPWDERAAPVATYQYDYQRSGVVTSLFDGCSRVDLAVPFGVLDFTDVIAFLIAFGEQDGEADLAEPFGTIDFSDVITYLTLFGAGCP